MVQSTCRVRRPRARTRTRTAGEGASLALREPPRARAFEPFNHQHATMTCIAGEVRRTETERIELRGVRFRIPKDS